MYNFIYEKRYLIGLLLFTFLVVESYHGSSLELWNNIIEPNNKVTNSVILGRPRGIRSDEWLVNTPINLSQAKINFSSNNDILGNINNNVTLYPNLPSKDISILATPNNLGYLFLPLPMAFSFSWYFNYFILFFASFELFMILTNKKIYSFVGAIMITFSPVVQWWQNANILAYGTLAVVLFNKFFNQKNKISKLFIAILFGYSGFLFIMCMYPAWQIPYGYCYLIILIWLLYINKDKLNHKDLVYLIPILLVIFVPLFLIFKNNKDVLEIMTSTVYPGNRISTGGGEWRYLLTYVIQMFFPFVEIGNPCEISQFISLFPIPLIYGIYLMIKNKKVDLFILLVSILTVILFIWVCFPLPEILSKITLLSMSTEVRAQVAIGYISILELFYIISNYSFKNNKISLKVILITLFTMLLIIYISNSVLKIYQPNYMKDYIIIISFIIFSIIISLFIFNNFKYNYLLLFCLFCVSFFAGFIVSPIAKGVDVFYEKPLAKELNLLNNSDNTFMATDSGITLANYLAVNGVKTINTTNFLPNLDLYHKLDNENKYNDIYNRYEHVEINLIKEPTRFELVQEDYIKILLNTNDICKIDVDYLVTTSKDEIYKTYENIYNNDGMFIYKTGCEVK